jgi:hypothetical protein
VIWEKQFAHNLQQYSSTDIVAGDKGETYITAAILGGSGDQQEIVKLSASGNILWTDVLQVPVRSGRSLYLDNGGNLLALLDGFNYNFYTTETYVYKINTNGFIIDSDVLPVSDPVVSFKGTNLYVLGGDTSYRLRVLGLTYNGLTVVTDFQLPEDHVLIGSIRADDAGSIYVGGGWLDNSSGKQYGFVEKYNSAGQLIWDYVPSVEGAYIELDNDNNVLAPFHFCLVKIYQCDNTSPDYEPTCEQRSLRWYRCYFYSRGDR